MRSLWADGVRPFTHKNLRESSRRRRMEHIPNVPKASCGMGLGNKQVFGEIPTLRNSTSRRWVGDTAFAFGFSLRAVASRNGGKG